MSTPTEGDAAVPKPVYITGAPRLTPNELAAELDTRLGLVSDRAASTIAAAWGAPSGVGAQLTALASGARVEGKALLTDVRAVLARQAAAPLPLDVHRLRLLHDWTEARA